MSESTQETLPPAANATAGGSPSAPLAHQLPDQKISLEQYRNVIGYLQYENSTYWTRSGFMLVTHSALFALLARLVAQDTPSVTLHTAAILMVAGVLGIVFSVLWIRVIRGALVWIEHWHEVLLTIEPAAYGDIKVFRGWVGAEKERGPRHGTRSAPEYVAILFCVVWVSVGAYASFLFAASATRDPVTTQVLIRESGGTNTVEVHYYGDHASVEDLVRRVQSIPKRP